MKGVPFGWAVFLVGSVFFASPGLLFPDCEQWCREKTFFYDDNGGFQYDKPDCAWCWKYRCVYDGPAYDLTCVQGSNTLSVKNVVTDPKCDRFPGETVEANPVTAGGNFQPYSKQFFCAL